MSNPYETPNTNPLAPQATASHAELIIPGLENAAYPLNVSFKILALAPQLSITDATGKPLLYVKQKLFKFKEKVEVFTDKSKTTLIGTIKANKVLDWSARYFFETPTGAQIGSVGRKGMRSMWKASYETFNPGDETPDYKISEENPFAKIMDGLIGEIPIVGFASSYLFHPKYAATSHSNGQVVMRLTKKPALWEGKFELEKLADLTPQQELNLLLSFTMLLLLERARG